MLKAFVVGGLICCVGQFIMDGLSSTNLAEEEAATYTSIAMVFIGAFLTGLGIYDDIGRFGGAGSLVPITGFANSVAAPAVEFKSEGFVTGLGAKLFTVAGPVLVFGISASVLYGIVLYIIGLF